MVSSTCEAPSANEDLQEITLSHMNHVEITNGQSCQSGSVLIPFKSPTSNSGVNPNRATFDATSGIIDLPLSFTTSASTFTCD